MEKKEHKRHQQKHSGPKAQKKKRKKEQDTEPEQDERKRNPKAFSVQSAVRMAKSFHRSVLRQINLTLTVLHCFHLYSFILFMSKIVFMLFLWSGPVCSSAVMHIHFALLHWTVATLFHCIFLSFNIVFLGLRILKQRNITFPW